jgi:hypothetical protein
VAISPAVTLGLIGAGVLAGALLTVSEPLVPALVVGLALYLPLDVRGFPVSWFVLCLWFVRATILGRYRRLSPITTLAAFVSAWLLISLAFGTVRTPSTVAWTFVAVTSIAGAVLLRHAIDPERFAEAFVWLLLPLAAYAAVEAWLLQANPIFTPLTGDQEQVWSTYRAYASFPHPLVAGTVFAVGATVQMARMTTQVRRVSVVDVVTLIVLSGGVVATQSRSAAVAVACGWAAALLISPVGAPRRAPRRIAVALAGAAIVIGAGGLYSARLESTEAQTSSAARDGIGGQILSAAERGGLTGIGPGSSEAFRAERQIDQAGIESSLIGLALGVGLVGLIAFMALGVAFMREARSSPGTWPFGVATLAFFVSVSLYSALDNNPELLVLLAVLYAAGTPTMVTGAACDSAPASARRRLVTRKAALAQDPV